MARVVVFLGSSLPQEEARGLLAADYRPPARRGDIARLLDDPPDIVGLVDGLFFQSFSVSPKEILSALRAGITVLGASSIGALRAVELERYGMIGVGQIFRLYRTGRIDGDDEVALVLAPEDYRPLSMPLVNMRVALDAACAGGLLDRAEKRTLLRRIKAVYFAERTYTHLVALARNVLPPSRVHALEQYFREGAPDAKREDAIELLKSIRSRS